MICHTTGESLGQEDEAFMNGLTYHLRALVLGYATDSNLPDYASNAEAIKAQITRIQTRAQQ